MREHWTVTVIPLHLGLWVLGYRGLEKVWEDVLPFCAKGNCVFTSKTCKLAHPNYKASKLNWSSNPLLDKPTPLAPFRPWQCGSEMLWCPGLGHPPRPSCSPRFQLVCSQVSGFPAVCPHPRKLGEPSFLLPHLCTIQPLYLTTPQFSSSKHEAQHLLPGETRPRKPSLRPRYRSSWMKT